MSDPQRPDTPDRDPVLDAAWKAHSTELPPSHVDAAILAAAHREARARPRMLGDDDALAEAREPARAWWGLAAAATIGAIAFGIVQVTPPIATHESATVATDMPRATERSASPPSASGVAEERKVEVQPPQAPTATATIDPPAGQRANVEAPAASKRRSDPADAVRAAPSKPAERERAPAQASRDAAAPQPRRAQAQPDEREQSAASAATGAPAAQAPPASPEMAASAPRPFPGTAPAPTIAASPPPAPAPLAAAPAFDAALAKQEAARESGSARHDEARALPRDRAAKVAAAPEPRAEAQNAAGRTLALPSTGVQPRTPAAWIERVRALYAERKLGDAARELNAFRDAYPDADSRLPPELAAWAATVKRNP